MLKKHPTFVYSCKINAIQNGVECRYRVTVVQTGSSFLEGEERAAGVVREWLEQHRNQFDSDPDLKWLTGRPVFLTGLELESEAVRRLLTQMRKDGSLVSSVIEEITVPSGSLSEHRASIQTTIQTQ
jgi:hypothetical protein